MQSLNDGPVWISDSDVQEMLTPDMAYAAVHDALVCYANGDFDQPLKPYVRPGGRDDEFRRGRLITMPGFVGGNVNALGVKLIAGFPSNINRGLPRASGVVVLHSPETGVPEAVIDCRTLSACRTAAVAAICFDHLATVRPRRVGIIGAGPIAHETVRSLISRDRRIESISVFDIRADRRDSLIAVGRQISEAKIWAATSAEECVRASNVIITATTGAKKYLHLSWLAEDWLLIPLSLDDCMPDVLLAADKVVCDDFDQGNREGKLLHELTQAGQFRREDMYSELGQIVAGQKLGREGDERIYANLMGMAIEDLAVAARVYRAVLDLQTSC